MEKAMIPLEVSKLKKCAIGIILSNEEDGVVRRLEKYHWEEEEL